ncbi:hypothetical protein ACJMQP_03930 [Rhodopseudomonas palustris]
MLIKPEPRRLYLGRAAEVFALVDARDYEWCIRWLWGITWDRHKRKMYATRSTRRRRERATQIKVYLHKAILTERMGERPPTDEHTIGDHIDGDSLNDTRGNLRWATPRENALNRRTTK